MPTPPFLLPIRSPDTSRAEEADREPTDSPHRHRGKTKYIVFCYILSLLLYFCYIFIKSLKLLICSLLCTFYKFMLIILYHFCATFYNILYIFVTEKGKTTFCKTNISYNFLNFFDYGREKDRPKHGICKRC